MGNQNSNNRAPEPSLQGGGTKDTVPRDDTCFREWHKHTRTRTMRDHLGQLEAIIQKMEKSMAE